MMFHSKSSYNENFLAFPKAPASTKHFIIPKKIILSGHTTLLTKGEEVLNWQSATIQDNSNSLQRIDGKLDRLVEKTILTDKKINALSRELQDFYYDLTHKIGQNFFGQEFQQKESQIRQLQTQLRLIEEDVEQKEI